MPEEEEAPSPEGFVNHTPSLPSTSRSGVPNRRRRGATPDLPAADLKPRTGHAIHQPATSQSQPAAIAPTSTPPSSRRCWRRHRQDADKEGEQKSKTGSTLCRRPRLDKPLTDPPPATAKPATERRSEATLFASVTSTITGDRAPKHLSYLAN